MTSLGILVDRLDSLLSASPTGRILVGITGLPGSGKSTLTEELADTVDSAVAVQMDGFHFSNRVLHDLKRRDRKGAPDTFDVGGFVALLRRLREWPPLQIYAPAFDRHLDESLASAISIGPETRIVLVEGNYLLSDQPGWRDVRAILDECWYIETPEGIRRRRLVERHMLFGRTRAEAERWVNEVDEVNANVIRASRSRATLTFDVRDPSEKPD